MKTGKAVKVNLPNSKYHEKRGFVVSCNAHRSTVVLKDGTSIQISNKLLVEIAPYTDMSIKSEALEKVGNELQQIKAFALSEIERYSKYNTDASIEGAACCKRFLALINAVLHDNTI
jgi:hypothetical protein